MGFFFFLFLPLMLLFLAIFIYPSLIDHKPKTHQVATVNPSNEKPPLPPGRTGWPMVGETLNFISKVANGVPQDFVTERIKKYSSKVFKTSLIGQPMAILCGAEGNKFLFCNERKLVQAWYAPSLHKLFVKTDSLFMNNQQEVVMFRKTIAPFLNGVGAQKLIGRMDAIVRDHLQTNWDFEQIKVGVEVRKYTSQLGLQLFLSVDDTKKFHEHARLLDDLTTGINSLPINLRGTAYNRAFKASKIICGDLEDLIRQRKIDLLEKLATPTHDLLSHVLLATHENGQFMSNVAIACYIQVLMVGSYGTQNTALTFIMNYLAELPHVYNEVLREQMEIANSKEPESLLNSDDLRKMKYSWNVACEVMRLHPPSDGAFREAIIDITYAGFTIPKGWKLYWIANATHRDSKYFPDPEKFDPSRFDGNGPTPFAFVPFGGGARMCPGFEYAKVAILVFMHNVVTKFKWEKVIPNEEVLTGQIPKLSQGLSIRLYPHKP